ncbi:hypothetical protein G9P44_004387 [Scheffersomyces stipitis]|nr:hypothetical protein G9P44_004387 [Scheffersomyces stipitis]
MDTSINTLNPANIIVNYTLPNDPRVISVPFGAFDEYVNQSMQKAIIHGVSIGSCTIMLLIILIFNVKRKKSPAFYLNSVTLTAMIIRSALNLAYLLGPLAGLSFTFSGLVTPETNFSVSEATNAFQVIVVALIEASMTFQVFVVFQSPEVKKLGIALTSISAFTGAAAVGFTINSTIQQSRIYHSVVNGTPTPTVATWSWVRDVPTILFSTSVNIMSFILILKLGFAIKTRRYLGLRQFGSLHILLMMATQTLLAPSILILVHYGYGTSSNSQLILISYLLVVLSLPVSSIWAATANNSPQLPSSATLSFMNKTTSHFSESDGDDYTIAGSSYALFPHKLAKQTSRVSSKFSATTLKGSSGLTPTTMTTLPPDIEKIINGEYEDDEEDGKVLRLMESPTDDNASIDRILQGASADGFISITTHNIK